MIHDDFVRQAEVVRVIDGDTIEVMVDDGRRRYSAEALRILRIQAPEIKGVEKERGIISKNYLSSLLPVGSKVTIQTFKTQSFTRWLAEVWYIDANGNQINVSEQMINTGMAVPYMDK